MTANTARTSHSHPLIINTVAVGRGELGLTFCPGKKQADAMTGAWDRDMEADLAVVEAWGANRVISLLEAFEYRQLQVPQLPAAFAERFRWFDLPIPDKQAPDAVWLLHWQKIRADIKAGLAQGDKLLIHCKGGFGRTGTLAAMILMDHGYGWRDAITSCRRARELAVETPAQEAFLQAYRPLE